MPKSINLNPGQTRQPTYNAIYPYYIDTLNNDITNLVIIMGDKNVISYSNTTYQFTAKDTGTTYIIFRYGKFSDTGYVYISNVQNTSNKQANSSYVQTNTSRLKNLITLYPNPATNKITLVSSINGLAEIKLISSHGKTVKILKANFVSQKKQDVSVEGFEPGVYFVQIKIGDEIENIKFVKE